jgi:hypothetical protein
MKVDDFDFPLVYVWTGIIIGLFTLILIRLSVCLPSFGSKRRKKRKMDVNSSCRTMVIWGSG